MSATKEPVTVGGWYEHEDGTVGEYVWREGHFARCRGRGAIMSAQIKEALASNPKLWVRNSLSRSQTGRVLEVDGERVLVYWPLTDQRWCASSDVELVQP